MFNGWMSYAGTEIFNEARLAAYAISSGLTGYNCEPCPTLRTSLEHDPYTTPAGDLAPWYDTNIAESGQVVGFELVSIDGLGDTATRRVDELPSDGAVVGARRRASRQLRMTIRAYASNDCALNYAMAWLARVLRGKDCLPVSGIYLPFTSTGCASETLCMFTCCPATPEEVDTYLTSLYRVGVTEGPILVARTPPREDECALAYVDAEVIFTAGDPGWYSPLVNIIDTPLAPFYVGTTEPLAPYDITELCNPLINRPDSVQCLPITPPGCAETSIPLGSGFPIPCIGVPDPRTTYTQYNFYSIPIDTSGISQWLDLVPKLTYQPGQMSPTGSSTDPQSIENFEGPVAFQLRRVTPGSPCGEEADPCDVCLEMFAPIWPRSTPGVADWVERKLFRLEAGGMGLCPLPVYGRGLAPFNWPTLICGDDMCLDIYITTASDARAGQVRLDVMRRQDAQA